MDFFSSQPGAVVAVPSPGVPMGMFLDGWGGYLQFKSIITGFEVQSASGVQFMHSLRDFIYIYVFGERIGRVTLTGVSFAHACERLDEAIPTPDAGIQFLPNFHGLEYVLGYYNFAKVSTTGFPITIVLGMSTVLYGFLVGVGVGMQDVDRRVSQFSLSFQAIPQDTITMEQLQNVADEGDV